MPSHFSRFSSPSGNPETVSKKERKNMINIEGVACLYAKVSDILDILQDTCSYSRAEITVVLVSGFAELCRLPVPVFCYAPIFS